MPFFKTKPMVVSQEDQEKIPPFPYGVKGMTTRPTVNPWIHDAKTVSMGTCDHAPDMDDAPFVLAEDKCEIFYCAKGSLWVVWEDKSGNKGDLKCKEGEHIWLPGGYKYTIKGTGEQSKNVWVNTIGIKFDEEELDAFYKRNKEWFPDFVTEMEKLAKQTE